MKNTFSSFLIHPSNSLLMTRTQTQVMGTQLRLFFGDSDLDSDIGDSRLDSDSRFSDSNTTLVTTFFPPLGGSRFLRCRANPLLYTVYSVFFVQVPIVHFFFCEIFVYN